MKMFIFRFKKLNLPSLQLDESYIEALHIFYKELNDIYDHYLENQNSPAIPRNFPPVTGSISWFRQISSRLEEIMMEFEVRDLVIALAIISFILLGVNYRLDGCPQFYLERGYHSKYSTVKPTVDVQTCTDV